MNIEEIEDTLETFLLADSINDIDVEEFKDVKEAIKRFTCIV